ncbi:MAG: iron ABC transporter permease [Ilumatobacter sp.]|uniref:ABC transporter permease n=1 Tax=Ilumatobacter sp. TaxID=1967498 RepID=UPI003C7842FF
MKTTAGLASTISRRRPSLLGVVGLVIGVLFAIPAGFVVVRAIRLEAPIGDTWSEIDGPLWRTIQLAFLVSASAAVLGTLLAWVTVRTDLPFRRVWRVVLVLPLVLPSFVGAGAFIAGIAPGGIIHEVLTSVGVTPPRRFRGLGASWFVLTAFTYPYVLLPVSARLSALRSSHEEGARMLGFGPRQAFMRVTLPEIRPSIVAGALLVFLYTLSEFGAVQLLGYDTLTRVIFATRTANRAVSFSAALALLVLAIAVVTLERRLRGRFTPDAKAAAVAHRPTELGWRKVPGTLTCAAALGVGLIIPISSLATWAQRGIRNGTVDYGDLVSPAVNTAFVSVIAAVITVAVVLPIAIETTRRPNFTSSIAAGAVLGGFAIPGLVIALALAVIALNAPGVGWLYQSLALLIIGYIIHFGSQALASTEQAVRSVPERVREQARLLEPSALRRAARVDLPLMRPGLLSGAGLVMLATLKELPATLLLSPIGFSSLATEIWGGFGEGFYAETGVASLLLIAVSASLTWLLVLRPSMRR